jgi:hypothetical protein
MSTMVALAIATSSLPARAEGAPGSDTTAVIRDGQITLGEIVATPQQIERSLRPRISGHLVNRLVVSSLTSEGATIEADLAALSPIKDGTSNTMMMTLKLTLDGDGFMDYTDDDCMFNAVPAKTVEQGLICAAFGHAWDSYIAQGLILCHEGVDVTVVARRTPTGPAQFQGGCSKSSDDK